MFIKEFEVVEDPRKHGKPFVAKLSWRNNKLHREFFQFDEHRVRNEITICGEYEVSPGDILEKRENVSWKNDWRTYYLVEEDGSEHPLCRRYEGRKFYRVKKYLMGKITLEEMLEQIRKL